MLAVTLDRSYNLVMATNNGSPVKRDAPKPKVKVSKLGRDLRKLSDLIRASGLKPLNRREIEREVAERRGAR